MWLFREVSPKISPEQLSHLGGKTLFLSYEMSDSGSLQVCQVIVHDVCIISTSLAFKGELSLHGFLGCMLLETLLRSVGKWSNFEIIFVCILCVFALDSSVGFILTWKE